MESDLSQIHTRIEEKITNSMWKKRKSNLMWRACIYHIQILKRLSQKVVESSCLKTVKTQLHMALWNQLRDSALSRGLHPVSSRDLFLWKSCILSKATHQQKESFVWNTLIILQDLKNLYVHWFAYKWKSSAHNNLIQFNKSNFIEFSMKYWSTQKSGQNVCQWEKIFNK